MRTVRASLLAGAAMIVFAGWAYAESPNTHVLTIHLPGGGIEQIRYSGDIPPEIYLSPEIPGPPGLFSAFGSEPPFAEFDRIWEEMDRRAARLLQEAAAMTQRLPPDPNGVIEASSPALPPGAHSYTFVSSVSGQGVCARSVEITSSGDGKAPRVVTRTYGPCGGSIPGTPRSLAVRPKPEHRPKTITVKAQGGQPARRAHPSLIQEAAWRQ